MKLPKGFKLIEPVYGDFQTEAIGYGILHQNAGLLLGLGAGKTYCSINVARYRIQNNAVRKVLVVCPPSILQSWYNSIKRFSEYDAVILHDSIRKKRIAKFHEEVQFYLINYQALKPYQNELILLKPDMVIFDESHRFIKNPRAKRTITSIIIADQARYKLILTGTLIGNKPIDLWAQFRALDGGSTFGTNFWKWRSRHFNRIQRYNYIDWKLKASSAKLLGEGISNTCIIIPKSVALPYLPKQLYKKITLPMDVVRDTYEPVREHILSEIETEMGKKNLNIRNILTRLLRLQQITSGFISDRGAVEYLKSKPKLDALMDVVGEIVEEEESVIIWCRFKPSIAMIADAMKKAKIKYLTMSGDDKDKFAKWGKFQEDSSISVFIGQSEAGGIGTELFKMDSDKDKSQHMVFYENTWSKDIREQAEGRNHRIGQESTCIYIDILIEDTIDTRIMEVIQENAEVAKTIMKHGVRGLV